MNWIKAETDRDTLMTNVITKETVEHLDCKTHVWVVRMNNRGTSLLCYATAHDENSQWYYKIIPEDVGPDVFDCPLEFLDMCVPRNFPWREEVRKFHNKKP